MSILSCCYIATQYRDFHEGMCCLLTTNRQFLGSNLYLLFVSNFIFQALIVALASIFVDQTKETEELGGKQSGEREDIWNLNRKCLPAVNQLGFSFWAEHALVYPPQLISQWLSEHLVLQKIFIVPGGIRLSLRCQEQISFLPPHG